MMGNRKKRFLLLGGAVLLCFGLYLLLKDAEDAFISLVSFPFAQIGILLRALSLSGAWGNGFAIALYVLLSLSPVLYAFHRFRAKRGRAEDGLLFLFSAALFIGLYILINPSYMVYFSAFYMIENAGKALLGTLLYSILGAYIILCFLRGFGQAQKAELLRKLQRCLLLVCILFVFRLLVVDGLNLKNSFDSVEAGNSALKGLALYGNRGFLLVQFLLDALAPVMGIVITFLALDLTDSLQADPYGEALSLQARRMAKVSYVAILGTMLTRVLLNVLQFCFGQSLHKTSMLLSFPLFSIILFFAALFFSRYFEAVQKIKDDSDSII